MNTNTLSAHDRTLGVMAIKIQARADADLAMQMLAIGDYASANYWAASAQHMRNAAKYLRGY